MAISLPAGMPDINFAGYNLNVGSTIKGTPFSVGLGKQRQLSLRANVSTVLTWTLTQAQFQSWEYWWQFTAQSGTLEFNVNLVNGYSEGLTAVRPLESYKADYLNDRWRVSLQVEITSQPIASSSELADAIANYNDLAMADSFHVIVHQLIPWGLS